MRPMTPGKKKLLVWWNRQNVLSRDIDLRAGQTLDLGSIELRDVGHRLHLALAGSDGSAVEEGRVYAIGRSGDSRWLCIASSL